MSHPDRKTRVTARTEKLAVAQMSRPRPRRGSARSALTTDASGASTRSRDSDSRRRPKPGLDHPGIGRKPRPRGPAQLGHAPWPPLFLQTQRVDHLGVWLSDADLVYRAIQ